MPPCDRCRAKALKVVAKAHGLISVAIAGDEKLEVVGDGVDPVCLVRCLRKKVCCAEILQVEEVKDKKSPEAKPQPTSPPPVILHQLPPPSCPGYCSCHRCHSQQLMMVCEDDRNTCAIM
ncbi:unnamed protein product [Urochloa humidicola]